MVVPVAIRKALSEAGESALVLQRNFHHDCINVYAKAQWIKMLSGFQTSHSVLSERESSFIREFNRGSAEVEPDESSGRILIPRKLLDRIGARDEVVLVGQGLKLEIWEKKRYEEVECPPGDTARMASEMHERLCRPRDERP
jgi:MraZ protein